MEEDIKILEEKLKIIESLCTDDCINKSTVIQPLKYALENLIKGYRELDKKNTDILEKLITERMVTKVMSENIKGYQEALENSIPKSKITELYKEYYEKAFAEPYDCTTADYKHSQAMGGWRALNKLLMEDK